MHTRALSATLSAVLLLAACEGNPSGPTIALPPGQLDDRPVWHSWRLIERLTSRSGPSKCLSIPDGYALDWSMWLMRQGDHLQITWEDTVYQGLIQGNDFAVEATFGVFGEGDCSTDGRAVDRVSGSFRADGKHLDGVRVLTYRLVSGADVSYAYEWTANQQ